MKTRKDVTRIVHKDLMIMSKEPYKLKDGRSVVVTLARLVAACILINKHIKELESCPFWISNRNLSLYS